MAHSVIEKHRHQKYPGLALELRSSSRYWQARTYTDGRLHQKSTQHTELRTALRIAESWYRDLVKSTADRPAEIVESGTETMQELFQKYKAHLPSEPRQQQAAMRWGPIRAFWKAIRHEEIRPKTFHDYYQWRRKSKASNSTIHKDLCLVRQLLRYACEQGLRDSMPIVPRFGSIPRSPRPWLTRDEFETLMGISQIRINEAKGNPRVQRQRQDLDDFLFFMVESMMRVNEVRELTVGQVRVVTKKGQDPYLLIDAKGKTGLRTVVAGGEAPAVFKRRSAGLKPADKLWSHGQRDAFRELLIAADLRSDAFGVTRNLKSMRCTAISFYMLNNPNVNLSVVAKNSGTSVQMLDSFYLKRLTAEMHVDELNQSNVI